jgi:hypothetical protein
MLNGRIEQRTVYAITIVTILAVAGGWAAAYAFTTTSVYQHNGSYNVINQGVANWPNLPIVEFGVTNSTCTQTGTFSEAGVDVTVLQNTSATCTVGDFAEVFGFTSAATVVAGTDTFTFTAVWVSTAGAVTYQTTVTFTLTDTAGVGGQNLFIALDFGQVPPPTQITTLYVVVTGA